MTRIAVAAFLLIASIAEAGLVARGVSDVITPLYNTVATALESLH